MQEIGWAKSYSHPGGQITGLAWDQVAEIVEKYPQFMKELVPNMIRLGTIEDLSYPGLRIFRTVMERAAAKLGLNLVSAEVSTSADLEAAFEKLKSQRAQAVSCLGKFAFLRPHAADHRPRRAVQVA